jgi:hypothetical protein
VSDKDEYPRFEACLERFQSAWTALQAFAMKEKLGEPDVVQAEVTYVNHIPLGDGWDSLAEVGRVLPDLQWRTTDRTLPMPETFAWQAAFRPSLESARLHLKVQHALRTRDRVPVLLCEVTVRGVPVTMSLQQWMLEARSTCVSAFADITASDLQRRVWGRR